MKLDVEVLRYLSRDEFRVLTAVELGMRNHELVPKGMVEIIAGIKRGGTFKSLGVLLKHKLVHHESLPYDSVRLTNLGYDYLALKTLVKRGRISRLGRQIGVGKEADVYEASDDDGNMLAIKFHRLGRTSFRAVRRHRDYLKDNSRKQGSWLYLSRLAALKEYAFMQALKERGFRVPQAVDQNRHCVLMELVQGPVMYKVPSVSDPSALLQRCLDVLCELARCGLVHCDYNEFNLIVDRATGVDITVIDFPQMVAVTHPNAAALFARDARCLTVFFEKQFGYVHSEPEPRLEEVLSDGRGVLDKIGTSIAESLKASGFNATEGQALDELDLADLSRHRRTGPVVRDGGDSEDSSDESEDGGGELGEEAERVPSLLGGEEALLQDVMVNVGFDIHVLSSSDEDEGDMLQRLNTFENNSGQDRAGSERSASGSESESSSADRGWVRKTPRKRVPEEAGAGVTGQEAITQNACPARVRKTAAQMTAEDARRRLQRQAADKVKKHQKRNSQKGTDKKSRERFAARSEAKGYKGSGGASSLW